MNDTSVIAQRYGPTTRGRMLFVLVALIAWSMGALGAGSGPLVGVPLASHRPEQAVLARGAAPIAGGLPKVPPSAPRGWSGCVPEPAHSRTSPTIARC